MRIAKILFIILIFFISLFILVKIKSIDETVSLPQTRSVIPLAEQLNNLSVNQFTETLKSLPLSARDSLVAKFISENPNSPLIEADSFAFFFYYGSESLVQINGDIQFAWQKPDTMESIPCGAKNFFYKAYVLPPDTRIDYEMIMDSTTTLDPRNPCIVPSGFSLHSECRMPFFKPKIFEIHELTKRGAMDSIRFTSLLTSIPERYVKIYKPYSYDQLTGLPVLFINDGFKFLKYSDFLNTTDYLVWSKKISPILIVFIEYIEGDQSYFLNETDEYITAICDELLPLIESNYHVSSSPELHAIAGISAGGHISFLTAFNRPDKFLKAAGQSSTVTEKLFDALADSVKDYSKYNLYLDVGRFDLIYGATRNMTFLRANQSLHKQLSERNITSSFKVYNDGHQWANWRERIDDILIYFFGTNR